MLISLVERNHPLVLISRSRFCRHAPNSRDFGSHVLKVASRLPDSMSRCSALSHSHSLSSCLQLLISLSLSLSLTHTHTLSLSPIVYNYLTFLSRLLSLPAMRECVNIRFERKFACFGFLPDSLSLSLVSSLADPQSDQSETDMMAERSVANNIHKKCLRVRVPVSRECPSQRVLVSTLE